FRLHGWSRPLRVATQHRAFRIRGSGFRRQLTWYRPRLSRTAESTANRRKTLVDRRNRYNRVTRATGGTAQEYGCRTRKVSARRAGSTSPLRGEGPSRVRTPNEERVIRSRRAPPPRRHVAPGAAEPCWRT